MAPFIAHEYDILVLGTGLSGVYSLYRLRQLFPHAKILALEAGTDVGGVWHWNSYPGCRIDVESLSYAYSFDRELLQEWEWKEAYAAQPDTLAYIRHVTRKHDLYRDIRFNTRIKSATLNEARRTWTFVSESGESFTTRFFVSCLGFLSNPTSPDIPGINSFKGQSFHTSRWPADLDAARDFAGKRVGVIGTGATGIQLITALSKISAIRSIHVFQRTANWAAPLHNHAIGPTALSDFDRIFQTCADTPTSSLHQPDPRKTKDVSPEDREEFWEGLYSRPGFAKWLSVFSDAYTDREANDLYSRFMAGKIRERVNDPIVAESLIPKDHGYGTRRVPLESGYFEAFNRDNVTLVDLKKTPIEKMREEGIQTFDGKIHSLDVLIFATGFDAITGAFTAIDWHAKNGKSLDDIWPKHQPKTYLGLMAPAMPNGFMVLGPHQPLGNATRSIEHAVEVIADMLQHCRENNFTSMEPTAEAVQQWTEHVMACVQWAVLVNEIDSWVTGVNRNVKGKETRSVAVYAGSAIEYRRRCRECKEGGYQAFAFA